MRVSDVSPLARLTALQSLDLEGTQVRDVSPLAGLTALQGVDLRRTPVNDVSPLAGLRQLTIHGGPEHVRAQVSRPRHRL
jgi:Leucine-rich repeat (LRR) protein